METLMRSKNLGYHFPFVYGEDTNSNTNPFLSASIKTYFAYKSEIRFFFVIKCF
jgi:hypothetical protein